jgi:hypothetical protein
MAKVTVTPEDITPMVHWCGEIINVVMEGTTVSHYETQTGTRITTCPMCLQVIEFQELQILKMVQLVGWP